MLQVEKGKTSAGQHPYFVVEALDKAAGQATLEEIGDRGPIALKGVQERDEGSDGLLTHQEHPGFEVCLGLLSSVGLLEDGKQLLAEGIHQVQFRGIAKKAFQECFFGILERRAMFTEDQVSAFQSSVGLGWQFFLQTRQFTLSSFLG